MCVLFNNMTKPPDQLLPHSVHYGLLGGAAFSQVRAERDAFHARSLDLGNAFSMVEMPPSWWPFMCGPRVFAKELDRRWWRPGWTAGTVLRPAYRRLGMGSTHAAYLLMAMVLQLTYRAVRNDATLVEGFILNLRRGRLYRVRLHALRYALYLHIDELLVMAASAARVAHVRHTLARALTDAGFIVTTDDPHESGSYVGLRPCSGSARWLPEDLKLGLLHRFLDDILARRRVSVDVV